MGTDAEAGGGRSFISARLVVVTAIAALALVFVFQNTDSRRVDFLVWNLELPSWLWMLVLFLAGALVGSVFPWFRRRRDDD